jgi:O-antigen ligase
LILYIAFTFIFTNYQNLKKDFFVFITILAGMECIYCILQFLDITNTDESSIKVTGSWLNPNITAMFLALVLPYVLLSVLNKLTKYRKLFLILLTLIFVSLILLKCRTAFLGSLLATALMMEWHYKICQNFISKSSKKLIFAASFLFILLIIFIVYFTYYIKKDSADAVPTGDTTLTDFILGGFKVGGTSGLFYKNATPATFGHEAGHALNLNHTWEVSFLVPKFSTANIMDYTIRNGVERLNQFWYAQWMKTY